MSPTKESRSSSDSADLTDFVKARAGIIASDPDLVNIFNPRSRIARIFCLVSVSCEPPPAPPDKSEFNSYQVRQTFAYTLPTFNNSFTVSLCLIASL
jgi:hypothetical protein